LPIYPGLVVSNRKPAGSPGRFEYVTSESDWIYGIGEPEFIEESEQNKNGEKRLRNRRITGLIVIIHLP